MSNLSEMELQARLSASRATSFSSNNGTAMAPAMTDEPKRVRAFVNRPAVEPIFSPLLAQSGIDADRFETMLERRVEELALQREQRKASLIARSSHDLSTIRNGIESRKRSIGLLTAQAPSHAFYVTIDTPFSISSTPGIFLEGTHLEPWNSWAKFSYDSSAQAASESVIFQYLWQNPSNYYAIANVDGYIIANGFCEARHDGGFWPGDRFASIALDTSLTLDETWNQPVTHPLAQSDQRLRIFSIRTEGGEGFFSDPVDASAQAFRGADLRYTLFLVPPQATAVFEVSMAVTTATGQNGGRIHTDFASGNFQVTSPFVLVAIVSAPPAGTTAASRRSKSKQ